VFGFSFDILCKPHKDCKSKFVSSWH